MKLSDYGLDLLGTVVKTQLKKMDFSTLYPQMEWIGYYYVVHMEQILLGRNK